MERTLDNIIGNTGMVERILRPTDASEMLGVGKTLFYELVKEDPSFPKAITIGKGRTGFLLSEIQAYIQQLKTRRDKFAIS